MNIAQMISQRNKGLNVNMPLVEVQSKFKQLTQDQIKSVVELAKKQGISQKQIDEGLKMIQSIR